MSDRVLTIIRVAFRGLCFCSPKAAGALAFHLFCRPPNARKIKPVQSALQNITPALLKKAQRSTTTLHSENSNVFKEALTNSLVPQRINQSFLNINKYIFEPDQTRFPKPVETTLLLHGWSSRASHMLAFVQPLLDRGHRVLAVDLPAHGDSSGRQFHLPLGVQALQAVHDQSGPWDNIIAHSLGGAVATALLSNSVKGVKPISVGKLVLISSPNSIPAIFSDFATMIGLNQKAYTELCAIAERLTGHPLSTLVSQSQLLKAGLPTLVIHDTDDQEIPFSEAEKIVADNPQAQLHKITGHGHRRILYAEEAVTKATEFCLNDRIKPLETIAS